MNKHEKVLNKDQTDDLRAMVYIARSDSERNLKNVEFQSEGRNHGYWYNRKRIAKEELDKVKSMYQMILGAESVTITHFSKPTT